MQQEMEHIRQIPRSNPNPAAAEPKAAQWKDFTATWYTPAGGEGNGLVTATGALVDQGKTIAVDPSIIPLGSTVIVKFPDGHKHKYLAEDTGGAIKGNRLDIFVWSQNRAIENGRQQVKVEVVK